MKYLSILICFISMSFAEAQVKIDSPVARYESLDQLNALYKQYGTMIIAGDYIFRMPCECYCRNIGGDKENRNLGGNTERRGLGGDTENRRLGGDMENRNLGGNTKGRNLGGNKENRNLAGNTERRNLSGDMESRNLGGDTERRNLGGDAENRNLGGNMENRNLGGNKENRNLGGQISSFTCFKNQSGDFFFSGVNSNTRLLLFEGVYLEEISPYKIK